MTTADDVRQQLDYVYALAYGRARITAAAEAASASLGIDDTALQLEAHQLLVEAYVQGSERWKAMAPFSWCLALYKNHPEYFDEERLDTLRWQYKWIIEMVCKNPDIKRSQIEALFKQFSDFYHEQGLSSHTVYGIGVWMYQSLGELDLAYEQLTSWRATPTDEFSDCPACDLQIQVDYATAVEDWQLALSATIPMLGGALGCADQPQATQARALLPMLYTNRPKDAWDAHLRSYRVSRRDPGNAVKLGLHLQYLALSGHLARGLRALRETLPLIKAVDSAYALWELLVGAALVARESVAAGQGQGLVSIDVDTKNMWCPGMEITSQTTMAQLYEGLTQWAYDLAAKFDARNQNSFFTDTTRTRLERETFKNLGDADDSFASLGVDLLEIGEELPDGVALGEKGGLETIEAPARPNQKLSPLKDDELAPYPAVDLSRPKPVTDVNQAMERYIAQFFDIGTDLEFEYLMDQLITPGYAEAIEAMDIDPVVKYVSLAGIHSALLDPQRAITWRARAREAVLERLNSQEASRGLLAKLKNKRAGRVAFDESYLVAFEISDIDSELSLEQMSGDEDSNVDKRTKRQQKLESLYQLTADMVERGCEERERQKDFDSFLFSIAGSLIGTSLQLEDKDLAAKCLELRRTIAQRPLNLEAGQGQSAMQIKDILDIDLAEYQRAIGKVYDACALADELMRRYDPCPPRIVLNARLVIARASVTMGEYQEAVRQCREMVNVCLTLGQMDRALTSLLFLAQALGQDGRYLESAEIIESGLNLLDSRDLPAIRHHFVRTLAQVQMAMGELGEAADNFEKTAEFEAAQGNTKAWESALEYAASCCEENDEFTRAFGILMRLADGYELKTPDECIDCERTLRRAAGDLVQNPTLPQRRANFDRAAELMERARKLAQAQPASPRYLPEYEMGSWHYDFAVICWNCEEISQCLEHAQASYESFMSDEDLYQAPRAMAMVVRCHIALGQVEQARAAIAKIRAMLDSPKYRDHPALEFCDEQSDLLDAEFGPE